MTTLARALSEVLRGLRVQPAQRRWQPAQHQAHTADIACRSTQLRADNGAVVEPADDTGPVAESDGHARGDGPRPQLSGGGVAAVGGIVVAHRADPTIGGDSLIRMEGFTERPQRHHAKDVVSLDFSEIWQAVSWLCGTLPRGLAGPLPTV